MARIGIIGGSGLYQLAGLEDVVEQTVETPFGAPSDSYLVGRIGNTEVAFLARHGRGHRVPPDQINYRANIFGFKVLGVEQLVSVSAVGSMRPMIQPGHLVLVDQFFDRTNGRASSFFGTGLVAHVSLADPVCEPLRRQLLGAARELSIMAHDGGTYVCMNGPQFSTRAESNVYRSWGVSVIGMTNIPEAKLAREAEICYATIALATDYDCWHEEADDVTVEGVIATLKKNVANAGRILQAAIPALDGPKRCGCQQALQGAIMTAPEAMDPGMRADLGPILNKYLD